MTALGRAAKAAGNVGAFASYQIATGDTVVRLRDNAVHVALIAPTAAAGTTTLAASGTACLSHGRITPGRRVVFHGTHDTRTITFNDTNVASKTRGTINLGATTRVLGNDDTLEIEQIDNGSWREIAFSQLG